MTEDVLRGRWSQPPTLVSLPLLEWLGRGQLSIDHMIARDSKHNSDGAVVSAVSKRPLDTDFFSWASPGMLFGAACELGSVL